MIENKKTEKWDSLRLDLQQFSPQEFVAACWYFECIGDDKGKYFFVGTTADNHTEIHSTLINHKIPANGYLKQDAPPAQTSGYVVNKLSGGKPHPHAIATDGYRINEGNQYHFSTSGWIEVTAS